MRQNTNLNLKKTEKKKTGKTNRNSYQPCVFCPADDIEARLALFGVGHAER